MNPLLIRIVVEFACVVIALDFAVLLGRMLGATSLGPWVATRYPRVAHACALIASFSRVSDKVARSLWGIVEGTPFPMGPLDSAQLGDAKAVLDQLALLARKPLPRPAGTTAMVAILSPADVDPPAAPISVSDPPEV